MDAGKGQRLRIWDGTHEFRLLIAADPSAAQFSVFVEQQVTRAFPLLNSKRCERAILVVKLEQALKINRADNVHVVKDERLIKPAGILQKEPACLFQAAACV